MVEYIFMALALVVICVFFITCWLSKNSPMLLLKKFRHQAALLFYREVAAIISTKPVARWLINRYKFKHPDFVVKSDDGKVYLTRWSMLNPIRKFQNKDGTTRMVKYPWLPINIRVHRFSRPDKDEHYHDHPWDAISLVFAGAYVEQRPYDIGDKPYSAIELNYCDSGDVNDISSDDFHKVTDIFPNRALDPDGVWTIFITFKKTKSWGFLEEIEGGDNTRVVPWREYLENK